MSVKREVSKKKKSSVLSGSKRQCLVGLQIISIPKEFFKEALQHETRENIQKTPQ